MRLSFDSIRVQADTSAGSVLKLRALEIAGISTAAEIVQVSAGTKDRLSRRVIWVEGTLKLAEAASPR